VKYCNQSVCESLCHMCQKPHVHIFQNFLYMLLVAVAWSSFNNSAKLYVLPFLWMTSYFHIMSQVLIQACSLRHYELFTVTCQVAPLNCSPGGQVCYYLLPYYY